MTQSQPMQDTDITHQETEAEVLSSIVEWSVSRPVWQQDALRRLCLQENLEQDDIQAFVKICKGEFTSSPLTADHIRDPSASNKKVNLKKVHGVQHVNALAPDQQLTFASQGLTIIYGDNGSGKSGYTRILKQMCRARSRRKESILGNIYEGSSGLPQAEIAFTANGANQSFSWEKDQPSDPLLSSVSVFDSATASIHVDETNDVAYIPFPMELLKKLVDAAKAVKTELQKEIDEIKAQTPQVIKNPKCQPDSHTGQLIQRLNANTPVETVEKLTVLSEEETKRLEVLTTDLANDRQKLARQLQARVNKLVQVKNDIERISSAITDEQANELKFLHETFITKKQAAELAAGNLFKDDPLPNVGGSAWKVLWEAAQRYSQQEAYPAKPFPVVDGDARCVLCHQTLDDVAVDRLNRFQAFVTDDTKKQETLARSALEQRIALLKGSNINHQTLMSTVRQIHDEFSMPELANDIKTFFIKAKWRLRALIRLQSLPGSPLWNSAPMESEKAALEQRVADLTADDVLEKRKQLSREKSELSDRVWLAGIKEDVVAEIERKKEIAKLTDLQRLTETASITRKSTDVSEALVTNALRARFSQEVDQMNLAGLAVELKQQHSSAGVPQFRVVLTQRPEEQVGKILSEGEFRCIALASFLAELATTQSNSAIVFDDPVSSLDHMHREAVANRLAKDALNRQVIVFTHDIAFLFYLNQAAQDHGSEICYRHITKRPTTLATGICHNNAPPKAQPVDKRIEGLQNRLDNEKIHFENGNDADWYRTVRAISDDIRETWERAVEDIVGVVTKRFTNKVNTAGLAKITAVTLDDCKKMRESFQRCSVWLHSSGESLNPNLPTVSDVQAEITILRDWYQELQSRQKDIKF